MADINIKDLSDLNTIGSDLFDDSEDFTIELSDEIEQVMGGMRPDVNQCSSFVCGQCVTR
jgi:hypothetical protein